MTFEYGKYYELGPRTHWLMIFGWSSGAVVCLLLALCFQLAIWFMTLPFITVDFLEVFIQISFGLAIVAEIIGWIIARLEYGVHRIMFESSSFHIVKGILHKHEVAIPYRRIQSVEIQQTLAQRIFKVAHLQISTTTDLDHPGEKDDGSHRENIRLIDYDLAREVAAHLTQSAEVERMRLE